MADVIKALEAKQNENIPQLAPGDTVSVHVKIKEGDRERIQEFKGIVIRMRKGGNDANITVRRMASNGIGVERKAARLRYLRNRWATRLAANPKIRLHTNLDPAHSCAIGTVQITGVPTAKVVARLWERWRIIATPIVHAEYEGARITPNVYTTLEEIDTFAAAMEQIAAKGTG